jgi:HEAT repeat protein
MATLCRWLVVAASCALALRLLSAISWLPPDRPADPDQEIEQLVRQLGSLEFEERETASKRLEEIGEPALDTLRRAATGSGDVEVRRRAGQLVADLEERLFPQLLQNKFGESLDSVRAILPPGWRITGVRARCTPPDWATADPEAGFLVEGGDGQEHFHIWFLPRDWVGIRKRPNQALITAYWHGILACDRYKIITTASQHSFYKWAEKIGGGLTYPWSAYRGYDGLVRIFGDKAEAADRIAQALIRQHCHSPSDFLEAAESLRVLGVPARGVFLRAAREVEGDDKDGFCWTLGQMGGDDAIEVLCSVVADARVEDPQRYRAVRALEGHRDPRIGPALHTALKQLRYSSALNCVVGALVHHRYEAVVPDLLKRLQDGNEKNIGKNRLASALAAFHCREAIPAVRRLVDDLHARKGTSQYAIREAELALLRLTGDWGRHGNDLRFMVLPPARAVVGQKMVVTVLVENIGTERLKTDWYWADGLVIDGKPLYDRPRSAVFVGAERLCDPGEVEESSKDISLWIKKPGTYTLQWVGREVWSSKVTLTVLPDEEARGQNP